MGLYARLDYQTLNDELRQIPPSILASVSAEMRLGDKDLMSLTGEEKGRLVAALSLRNENDYVNKGDTAQFSSYEGQLLHIVQRWFFAEEQPPPNAQNPQIWQPSAHGGPQMDMRAHENALNKDLNNISSSALASLRTGAGIRDKGMASLTMEEKGRIVAPQKLRTSNVGDRAPTHMIIPPQPMHQMRTHEEQDQSAVHGLIRNMNKMYIAEATSTSNSLGGGFPQHGPTSSFPAVRTPSPSASAMLAGPRSSDTFSTEFISNVAANLDGFDPNLFGHEADIDFERDFGHWFNSDDLNVDIK